MSIFSYSGDWETKETNMGKVVAKKQSSLMDNHSFTIFTGKYPYGANIQQNRIQITFGYFSAFP